MIYVWLFLLVLMIIAELATLTALVTIWFIPPAMIALILAYFNVSVWIQIVVFLIVSIFNLTQILQNKIIQIGKSAEIYFFRTFLVDLST